MLKTILALALLVPMAAAPEPATFTLSGTVTYGGEVPKPKPNKQLAGDPACCALHLDTPPKDDLVIGPSKGIRWTFVYIKKGIDGKFPLPADPVQLDQVGCIFTPHVLGVRAGQVVNFRNSDPMLHNVNLATFANKATNFSVPPGGATPLTFGNQEVMMSAACNVHPFMSVHIAVVEHPFFAVTDAEGKFEIKNLPAGKYTVGVWHEKLGNKTEREIAVNGNLTENFILQ